MVDPFLLSDEYVSRYADVIPPWGFNGLGYITYKRTYARPVFDVDGETILRTEEWHETVQRVVNGAQEVGAGLTEAEAKRLFDYIFFLKGSVAGRMLWQLGTENNTRLGGDSLVNCLGGETEVVTRDGIKRIDDLAKIGHATIMTDFGKWVTADIRCFGEQPLATIMLRRGRQTKAVRATANHRWIVRGKDGRKDVFTESLTPGMKLVSIKGQSTKNSFISNDGIRAGLVFGDGTVYKTGATAFVSHADIPELEYLFLDYKRSDTEAGALFRGLPRSYKSVPDYNEFRGYLFGWLAGYFAADGYARDGKGAQINSTNVDNLRAAKDIATLVGIATGPIYSQTRTSNLTDTESVLYTLPLHIEDPEFFLLSKHRGCFEGRPGIGDWVVDSISDYAANEPVYCAVVPDTHTFALADNLLTGNCWFVDVKEISDFSWAIERLMLGGGVGFSCDKPERLGVVRQGTVLHRDENDSDFIVPDKREGWGELIFRVFEAYLGTPATSSTLTYSTSLIRPAGTPIKTFGGTASGPDILIHGVNRICEVLDNAVGRYLTSVDVLDCMNIIGSIVVAGNVRRSAEIAVGSAHDTDYLMAKRWDLGNIPIERAMSNNSIFVSADEMKNLPDLVWEGYKGNGEPYGFINLEAARKFGRMGEERFDPTIVGVNPCVTADTWVQTKLGPRRVSELTVDALDVVSSFDATVNGKHYKAVPFWETGIKDVLKLVTSEGYSLRLTSNHKVLTPDKGWVEAGDLEIGDAIVLHDHFGTTWGGSGSEDDGYVLGHLVGDGTFYQDTPCVCVWDTDPGHAAPKERLTRIMSEMPHRMDWKGWRRVHDTHQVRSMHVGLRELAAKFGIFNGNKTITDSVEAASSDFYVGFLRGLFDTDGHVEGFSTAGGVSIRLSQSDLPMLEAVQRMLLRLGIKCSLRSMHDEGFRDMPGGSYWTKKSYRLIISGAHAERFMHVVGFEDTVKRAKWEERASNNKRGFYNKPMVATVADLTYDGSEMVYDCTVDEVHAFDANGLYVHNCAEIFLADRESCNLSEIFLPMIDSKEELVDIAVLLYKVQKAIAAMPYLDYTSDQITSANMRLGLGITGVAQALDKLDWLDDTYNAVRVTDKAWSDAHGWPESVRLTTIKPSGTLSLLPGVTPGVHPGFSRRFVKRMRMAAIDPLVKYCAEKGFHVEPLRNFDGSIDDRTVVVSFPCSFPDNTIVAENMSALQQLDLVRELQRVWADNSISVTVYYRMSELDEIREYLCEHWSEMKSVSFLLHNEHGFDQAPLGELSVEEYQHMLSVTKPLGERISGSTYMSEEDMASFGESCDTGVCPVR